MQKQMRTLLIGLTLSLGAGSLAFATGVPFEEMDSNGDGAISRAEARATEGIDFTKADTDGDGSLSRSEVAAFQGSATDSGAEPTGKRTGGTTTGTRVPGDVGGAGGVADDPAH